MRGFNPVSTTLVGLAAVILTNSSPAPAPQLLPLPSIVSGIVSDIAPVVSGVVSGIAPIVSPVECLAVDVVVTLLDTYPSATPFCSSYLGISTITSTVSTTTTLPVSTSTITTTAATSTVAAFPVVTTQTRYVDGALQNLHNIS